MDALLSNQLLAEKTEVKALTGLRGIAAAMVAVYHINDELSTHASLGFGTIIGRGYLWVDLFFVLSGFVMALNYGHRFDDGCSIKSWCDFLVRRIARIFPLYFVVTVVGVATLVLRDGAFATTLFERMDRVLLGLANLLMIQSWGIGRSIAGTAWSLSAEWAAYVAFPVLAGLALFGNRSTAAFLTVIAAMAAVLTVLLTGWDGQAHRGPLDAYDGATVEPLLRCVAGFVSGLLAYRIAKWMGGRALFSGDLVCGMLLGLLLSCLATHVHDLFIVLLFPFVILTLYLNHLNRGRFGKVLGCNTLTKLGIISYSIYLVHPFFVEPKQVFAGWLCKLLPGVASNLSTSVAIYVLLIAISALAYRYIEVPGRRFVLRLWDRSRDCAPKSATTQICAMEAKDHIATGNAVGRGALRLIHD